MKRFNCNTVRPLGNLQSPSEKEKAHNRRSKGIKVRWAVDKPGTIEVKKVRDFVAPVSASYAPCRLRGRSGTRLSAAKRAMILRRAEEREKFFASIGAE